jgi:hypothetical protein
MMGGTIMGRSYVDLLVEEIRLDFRRRKVRHRQSDLFSVLREGLNRIALAEGINKNHVSAYSSTIAATAKIFEIAKNDLSLSTEARADARQVLTALRSVGRPRQFAS